MNLSKLMIRNSSATRHCLAFNNWLLDETKSPSFKYHQYNDGQHRREFKVKYGLIPFLFPIVLLAKDKEDDGEESDTTDEALRLSKKKKGKRKRTEKFNFIADAVEKVMPSIVHIEVKRENRSPVLFGGFHSGGGASTSSGSGFVISDDGLIITNAHVVGDLNQRNIVVKLGDERSFNAKVLKLDKVTDLAVLKIDATNLSSVKLGDSTKVRTGEFVIALGSPLTLNKSVTSGIVSNPSRDGVDLGIQKSDLFYIQTDAMITMGNSGGPLVNLDGEVVGITSMMIMPGIAFAIPSKYASDLLNSKDGTSPRKTKFLGIQMISMTYQIYQLFRQMHNVDFKLPPQFIEGCLISQVISNSPAERSGLKRGDLIVKVNDIPVASNADVFKILKKESNLTITVLREGSVLVDVVLKVEEK